jgi:hypothetical protein
MISGTYLWLFVQTLPRQLGLKEYKVEEIYQFLLCAIIRNIQHKVFLFLLITSSFLHSLL